MLPSAGLFLPETLHRRDGAVPGNTEPDNRKPKYFQRLTHRPADAAQEAQKSVVSIAHFGSAEDLESFPSISTAFQFADFVSSSSKPSSESHGLAVLLHHVRQDVAEASRLYLSAAVANFLDAWPDRKVWIDSVLVDIRGALNDVGEYVDTFRVAGEDGGAIGLKRRFEWISSHQKRLSTKQQHLATCHQCLITAINIMQTVELCGATVGSWQDPIYEAPVQPWVKHNDADPLRGPYSRRETRKHLSLSNLYLPQPENDELETRSVNSIPAELPGSTPDDHAGASEVNQASFPQSRSRYRRSPHRGTSLERDTSVFVRRMATLPERTIERNDSATSTTAVVGVSRLARRHHPNQVYIYRPSDRHHSLPSKLPDIQSQSSLTEDLADWMVSLSAQNDNLESAEWNSSSCLSSPSISVVSSPNIAQEPSKESQHVEPRHSNHVKISDAKCDDEPPGRPEVSKDPQATEDTSTPELTPTIIREQDGATSMRSHTSSIARKPLPATARVDPSVSVPSSTTTIFATSSSQPSSATNATPPRTTDENGAEDSDTKFESLRSAQTTSTPSIEDVESPQLQQSLLDLYAEGSGITSSEYQETVNSEESARESLSNDGGLQKVVEDVAIPPVIAKPMTAQAKRRAEHRRRMELAFGGS